METDKGPDDIFPVCAAVVGCLYFPHPIQATFFSSLLEEGKQGGNMCCVIISFVCIQPAFPIYLCFLSTVESLQMRRYTSPMLRQTSDQPKAGHKEHVTQKFRSILPVLMVSEKLFR